MSDQQILPEQIEHTYESGLDYIRLGWQVFLLSRDDAGGKIPFKNCWHCDVATGDCRGAEGCECVLCHGFYAATDDRDLWAAMIRYRPAGYLAVRTGWASRLLVLDFEADGLETLDRWEEFTNGQAGSLPAGAAVAASQGGGRHLFYRIPDYPGETPRSGNRVLPGTDVKAEGGYVAVPGGRNERRRWLRPPGEGVAEAPVELLVWLANRGRRRSGRSGDQNLDWTANYTAGRGAPEGYTYSRFVVDGPPGGMRDYFFNDMIFRLRRRGVSFDYAYELVHAVWELAEQPPAAAWFMPWQHVEYKLRRVWHEVQAEVADPGQLALVRRWSRLTSHDSEAAQAVNRRRVHLQPRDSS